MTVKQENIMDISIYDVATCYNGKIAWGMQVTPRENYYYYAGKQLPESIIKELRMACYWVVRWKFWLNDAYCCEGGVEGRGIEIRTTPGLDLHVRSAYYLDLEKKQDKARNILAKLVLEYWAKLLRTMLRYDWFAHDDMAPEGIQEVIYHLLTKVSADNDRPCLTPDELQPIINYRANNSREHS